MKNDRGDERNGRMKAERREGFQKCVKPFPLTVQHLCGFCFISNRTDFVAIAFTSLMFCCYAQLHTRTRSHTLCNYITISLSHSNDLHKELLRIAHEVALICICHSCQAAIGPPLHQGGCHFLSEFQSPSMLHHRQHQTSLSAHAQ